ncbi:MAG: NifU family protein [Acidobacteriota bacterium]
MAEANKFQEKMERVEHLVSLIENCPDSLMRESALELVQTLMDFHGAGIERMMDITAKAGAAGYAIFDDYARDELTANLLLLYGLHPLDISDRILNAIEKVRPSLSLHEGDVELLGVDDGVVRLRLKGSCDGCPSSALTLKNTIEEAIYAAAPDVVSIEVGGVVETATGNTGGLVQIEKAREKTYTNCEFVAAAG